MRIPEGQVHVGSVERRGEQAASRASEREEGSQEDMAPWGGRAGADTSPWSVQGSPGALISAAARAESLWEESEHQGFPPCCPAWMPVQGLREGPSPESSQNILIGSLVVSQNSACRGVYVCVFVCVHVCVTGEGEKEKQGKEVMFKEKDFI